MSIDLDDIARRIADGIYGDDRMTKEGRDDAFSALNEIIAEVERLREEVAMLQQEARIRKNICDGLASEADAERAAVVAYLREPGTSCDKDVLADMFERGEHRREEER